MVYDRRRVHQFSLRRELDRGQRVDVQPGRARRGIHQLSVGLGTRGDMGGGGDSAGRRRAVAFRWIHRRDFRSNGVVGGASAGRDASRIGVVDGVGASVRQRDVRGLDFRRMLGDAAVHVLHAAGGGARDDAARKPARSGGGFVEFGAGVVDPARGSADRRVLLRLVGGSANCVNARRGARRPREENFGAARLARAPLANAPVRGDSGGALPVAVFVLRGVAAEHVLREGRSSVVGGRLAVLRRGVVGDGLAPAASAFARCASRRMAERTQPRERTARGLRRAAYGLSREDRRRSFRIPPDGFLLAFAGGSGLERASPAQRGRVGVGAAAEDPGAPPQRPRLGRRAVRSNALPRWSPSIRLVRATGDPGHHRID